MVSDPACFNCSVRRALRTNMLCV